MTSLTMRTVITVMLTMNWNTKMFGKILNKEAYGGSLGFKVMTLSDLDCNLCMTYHNVLAK
jgi:hypothetical protein